MCKRVHVLVLIQELQNLSSKKTLRMISDRLLASIEIDSGTVVSYHIITSTMYINVLSRCIPTKTAYIKVLGRQND